MSFLVRPPTISPSSGIYRPPIVVTIRADEDPLPPGCALYYTVQHAASADALSGADAAVRRAQGGGSRLQRVRYGGPFALRAAGRVKVAAFLHDARGGGGNGNGNGNGSSGAVESPLATALFVLDPTGPPPATPEAGSVLHLAPVATPLARAGAPTLRVPPSAAAAANAAAGLVSAATPTAALAGADNAAAMTPSPGRALVEEGHPLHDLPVLQFAHLPSVVRSFEPFSVTLYVVDALGYPLAATLKHPRVALSGDLLGAPLESDTPVVVVPTSDEATERPSLPIPWTQVHNVVCGGLALDTVARAGVAVAAAGWDAFADAAACVGGAAPACGVAATVAAPCRAIIALHTGAYDPAPEHAWRAMRYSLHFSADLDDPATVPAFRIYEAGVVVASVGTREFALGDRFAIKLRPSGRVAYLQNDHVVHTSFLPMAQGVGGAAPPPRNGQGGGGVKGSSFGLAASNSGGGNNTNNNNSEALSVHVRVAGQRTAPALRDCALLPLEAPVLIRVANLVWRPPVRALPAPGAGEPAPTGILRAWLVGREFVPAAAKVRLDLAPVPRWAFAGVTLAAMFALGALGAPAGHVPRRLAEAQQRVPQLSLHAPGAPRVPPRGDAEKARRSGGPFGGDGDGGDGAAPTRLFDDDGAPLSPAPPLPTARSFPVAPVLHQRQAPPAQQQQQHYRDGAHAMYTSPQRTHGTAPPLPLQTAPGAGSYGGFNNNNGGFTVVGGDDDDDEPLFRARFAPADARAASPSYDPRGSVGRSSPGSPIGGRLRDVVGGSRR